MSSVTGATQGSEPALPAVEDKPSPPKNGYHISDEDLRRTINLFDTLMRTSEKSLADELSKECDGFLCSVRQVALDQGDLKRALFINNVYFDNMSFDILSEYSKSKDVNLIKHLIEFNSLNVSPKDISDCRLRRTIDRFNALRRMANELSLIEIEEALVVKYHHFLHEALDVATQKKNWDQSVFINNIYVESMSTPVLLRCIMKRDRKELAHLLKIDALYISPSVLEAARKYPDIHRILISYLRDSTHLIRAAQRGMLDYVELSLKHGANPNMKNELGQTALHGAASSGHPDTVRTLLEKGADPNIADLQGKIPVIYAFDSGSKDILNLLFPVSTLSLSNNPHVSFELIDVDIQ